MHCRPPPGLPSSTLPSQLLSSPSHTSGITGPGTHWIDPLMQCCVPFLHSPSPGATHIAPPPGSPSSTMLLQLSSRPLQISGFKLQLGLPPAPEVLVVMPPWPVPPCPLPPAPLPPAPPCALPVLAPPVDVPLLVVVVLAPPVDVPLLVVVVLAPPVDVPLLAPPVDVPLL